MKTVNRILLLGSLAVLGSLSFLAVAQQCMTATYGCTSGDGYRFCYRALYTSTLPAPTGCVGNFHLSATYASAFLTSNSFIFGCGGPDSAPTGNGYCTFVCNGCTLRVELSDGLPVELLELMVD